MKIDNNLHHDRNVDMEKISYSNSYQKGPARIADKVGGFTLDISGTVTDNAAYGMGELKSADEVMQDAGQKDIALQRNYMAVMSNSMSAEDYKKIQEEGISVTDSDIETHVTSLDKIKAKLAESGTVIAGYNDDLTDDQINALAGGNIEAWQLREAFNKSDLPITTENVKGVLDAAGQAEGIKGLTEDVKKYMVANNIEPTIANLYKAGYSAGMSNGRQARGYYMDSTDGYYAKKADVFDMEQIRGQVEGIINKAGLEVNDETMAEAEWIIKSGLPITERTIGTLNRLDNLTLPLEKEDVIRLSTIAISEGKKPVDGPIDKEMTDAVTAAGIREKVDAISDEAIDRVALSGREINIRNLYEESQDQAGNIIKEPSAEAISARRQLEETRLIMSTEANIRLLRQGISIETEPLARLVEELKEAERACYEPLLLNEGERGQETSVSILDERISLFKQTGDVFAGLRTMPAEVLTRIDTGTDDFTARNISEQGAGLKAAYERAGRSYETLMTAPRADMGDSIKKAFANVDDILKDNGFELNDINRKAVRILGYSGTEINPETISRVREADRAVERVIDLMTPAKTLEIIRNGDNPIDTNIYELQKQLEENPDTGKAERYSRFLRRLEEKNEISDREKSAFIGVYRLFRQIEKSDGKLIGNVLSSGAEPTLRNILSASRSNRAQGKDFTVDDDFGGLSELNKRGTSISGQIDEGFSGRSRRDGNEGFLTSLAGEVLDKLTPDGIQKTGFEPDKALETFAHEIIEGYDREADLKDKLKEDLDYVKEARGVDDKVIEMLRDYRQPVTVNNLLAAGALMTDRGSAHKLLMKEAQKDERGIRLREAADKLTEGFVNRESAGESYREFTDEALRIAGEALDNADSHIDVREFKLLHKELSIAGDLARRQNYE
ncbi:MAG: DUF6240 domain-containing protein, partial [Lachnospiraceae bacterium]|nr:DUF6240 domain-containing protein [Lachnospiraceae bacterium]